MRTKLSDSNLFRYSFNKFSVDDPILRSKTRQYLNQRSNLISSTLGEFQWQTTNYRLKQWIIWENYKHIIKWNFLILGTIQNNSASS